MSSNDITPYKTNPSPANTITSPLQPTQGYGRLRHFHRMKHNQFVLAAHEPYTVHWDEHDLSSIIEVLESCGKPEGLRTAKQTRNERGYIEERKFDPRAPHFDVVLIDLTNAGMDAGDNDNDNGLKQQRRIWPVRQDINMLPMESLAGRPGWLFLWVGPTDYLVEGRRILSAWGFRKVECIGWLKTDNGWSKVNEEAPTGVFRNAVEWCLMGCKGSAKRTFDAHLIHCNLNTDVLVSPGPHAPTSSLLSNLIEDFSLGQRRLHLFARSGDERPGWITMGREMSSTNFNCREYLRRWGESGRNGWLVPLDPEIEYFRPKTPPLQTRRRERSGKPAKPFRERDRDAEPVRFPHLGQKTRAAWRPMLPAFRAALAAHASMDRTGVQFSRDGGATLVELQFPAPLIGPMAARNSGAQMSFPLFAASSGPVPPPPPPPHPRLNAVAYQPQMRLEPGRGWGYGQQWVGPIEAGGVGNRWDGAPGGQLAPRFPQHLLPHHHLPHHHLLPHHHQNHGPPQQQQQHQYPHHGEYVRGGFHGGGQRAEIDPGLLRHRAQVEAQLRARAEYERGMGRGEFGLGRGRGA